jgi:hypothetical protein
MLTDDLEVPASPAEESRRYSSPPMALAPITAILALPFGMNSTLIVFTPDFRPAKDGVNPQKGKGLFG